MTDAQPLPGKEQDIVSKALLLWLNQYPNLPGRIEYQFLPKNEIGLSVSGMQGALKLEEDIAGGFVAQYPFQIIYRCQPNSSGERMDRSNLLDDISEWIENIDQSNYPILTDGRKIIDIYTTSTTSLIYRDESGNEDYQALFNLEYMR